jgi:hypothetical protein
VNDNPSSRLCDELRREILSGRLAAGMRLETERELSVRYGISSTTINKIMTLLELEGLLERRRGLGTYVRADLACRAVAVVLGPMHAPPGAVFWADLSHLAVEVASKRDGGARCYFAAGTAFMAETPLAADARAGRVSGALLLAAGDAVAAVLESAGLPFVSLARRAGALARPCASRGARPRATLRPICSAGAPGRWPSNFLPVRRAMRLPPAAARRPPRRAWPWTRNFSAGPARPTARKGGPGPPR